MDDAPELSGRQRLELAMLEEDIGAADERDDGSDDAAVGALVKYLRDEGITQSHIYHPRESRTFTHARMAVILAHTPPAELMHECYGRRILIAAGLLDPNTPVAPDPFDSADES